MSNKINSYLKAKNQNLTIGLCHGTFDFLHSGHIQHFQEAKSICDFLVVSFTSNEFNRRKSNYFYSNDERLAHLESIKFIDQVLVVDNVDAESVINLLKPNFYIKGAEYSDPKNDKNGRLEIEKNTVEKYGGKLYLTSKNKVSSSSKLIDNLGLNNIKTNFPDSTISNILKILENASTKKIHVIGESITDVFIDGNHLGISPKSHCSVMSYESTEIQSGGSLIISKHLSPFVDRVILHSNSYNNLLSLPKNITYHKINDGKIEVIRYQDKKDGNKLFELKKNSISINKEKQFNINNNDDFILVSNFGLNLISDNDFKFIKNNKNRLIYMAQSNSSNHGLNRLDKIKGAYAYIGDLREIGLLLNKKEKEILSFDNEQLSKKLHQILDFKHFILTRGSRGLVYFYINNNDELSFKEIKSLEINKIVDTIGCGDATLSLFAIGLLGIKNDEIESYSQAVGELSNLAGSICTQWRCNNKSISKQMITSHL